MTRVLTFVMLLTTPVFATGQSPSGDDPLPKGAVARLGTTRFRHGTDGAFLAYLPDGKSLLSGATAWDPAIRQWDLEGREIRRFVLAASDAAGNGYTERSRLVLCGPYVALSPDGKRLAAWNFESVIHLWDVATGKERQPLQLGKDEPMPNGLAFSRDGAKLATLAANGLLVLREVETGAKLREYGGPVPPSDNMQRNPFIPLFTQDDRIVIGSTYMHKDKRPWPQCVKAWEIATGRELYALPGTLGYGAALSPDGKLLAYFGAGYKQILIADALTGEARQRIDQDGSLYGSLACAFSKDSSQLFVQKVDENAIVVFDVTTGKQKRMLGQPGSWSRAKLTTGVSLALSPDGNTVARFGDGQAAKFFDAASGKERLNDYSRYAARSVHFGPDGKSLLVGDESLQLRWWDWKKAKITKSFAVDGFESFPDIGTDGAGALAVSSRIVPSLDYTRVTLAVTDLSSKKQLALLADNPAWVPNFRVSFDGRTLAVQHSSEFKREAHIYDLPALKLRCITPMPAQNRGMVLSADGGLLAVYTSEQSLGIFEGLKGRRVADIELPTGCLRLFSGAFSPDKRMLAFDMEDGKVTLWETTTGKPRLTFGQAYDLSGRLPVGKERQQFPDFYASNPHSASVTVAFSLDGKLLAHGRLDGSVQIWDAYTGKRVATFKGHDMRVNAVAFSPDGAYLASGSSDTTVLVWKVPHSK